MKNILLILFTFFGSQVSFAQFGEVDLNFNNIDTIRGLEGFPQNSITKIQEQPDGKILVLTNENYLNFHETNNLVRLMPDGKIDHSFCSNIQFNSNSYVSDFELLNTGQIILGGSFLTTYGNSTVSNVMLLNSDGTLNSDFNVDNSFFDDVVVYGIELFDDGGYLIWGSNELIKLNSDGSMNQSYYLDLSGQNGIYVVKKLPNDEVLIGGKDISIDNEPYGCLLKINSNGDVDTNFKKGLDFDFVGQGITLIDEIELQNDGKLILAGNFGMFQGVQRNKIVRIDTNGDIDTSFYFTYLGSNIIGFINKILYTSDDKIMIAGSIRPFSPGSIFEPPVLRLNIDGSIDTNYLFTAKYIPQQQLGIWTSGIVYDLFELSSGNILVGGEFVGDSTMLKSNLVKYSSGGILDFSFNVDYGFNSTVLDGVVQDDNKMVFVGDFQLYNNESAKHIVRIFPNGDIDDDFYVGKGPNGVVKEIEIQEDGRMIIMGDFNQYDTNYVYSKVIRLDQNGLYDTSFNTLFLSNTGNYFYKMKLQNDNKLLIAGSFYLGNEFLNSFIRLNNDGSLDQIYVNVENDFITKINSIDFDSQNNIYILCNDNFIIKLDANLNYIQNIPIPFYLPVDFKISNDDNFIIGFNDVNGFNDNNQTIYTYAKVNQLGNVLSSFNANNFLMETAQKIYVQNDGKVYILRKYDENGTIITKLNSNGELDSTFNDTIISNRFIHGLLFNNQGEMMIYGEFNEVNGITRSKICKITNCFNFNITDTIFSCTPITWIDGITYTESNTTATHTLQTVTGCDSVVSLHLTIVNPQPISANVYVQPSHPDSCVGNLALHVQGNELFEVYIDDILAESNVSDYSLFSDLCSGVHTLKITDVCGDSLVSSFVIPVDSNYIFTNPFLDSIAVDSLGTTVENCEIDYNSIDTAYIDSLWATGNTVNVIWNIVDANGSNYDTTSFELNNGNGVYYLQLSLFCPNRALGEYFTVSQAIHFSDGSPSIVSVDELEDAGVFIFPNPTSSSVTIQLSGQSAQVKLYDAHGKFIREKTIISSGELSLVDVQSGIYMIEIITDQNRSIHKVIKQ